MADIFNEIDEELRQEQIRKLWDRYGVLVLIAAVVVVAAVAGWRGWDYWRTQQARIQGDAFTAATALARAGDAKGAEAAYLAVAGSSSGGYPVLARIRAAGALAESGDAAAALAAFDAIAGASATPPLLADLARIRAAYLAVDLEERPALEARLSGQALAGKPFRHQAREILALAAWKAGDDAALRQWLDALEVDPETPRDLLDRTALLKALLQARAPAGKVN